MKPTETLQLARALAPEPGLPGKDEGGDCRMGLVAEITVLQGFRV